MLGRALQRNVPGGLGRAASWDRRSDVASPLVTGGGPGIGKAVAWQLAKEGVDVAVVARDRAALETAAAEIAGATNRRVKGFVADTGDDAAVKAAVAQVLGDFGRVDILVNCAAAVGGQGKPPTLAEITNEPFFADMNVKVMGYGRTPCPPSCGALW
jgi:NAD(P)-dependent dehydrogenase (short-subunit alcohol dehydrogenase family)